MNKKYDVIIIGAGIGGLICGTKLAKKGLKVLIVEKHYKVGGCVTSCRRNGFNFDYGAHIFGSCNKNGILNYCLKELNIKGVDFIRLNPTERYVFPDQTIEVPHDFDEYESLLKSKYEKEAKNLGLFFKELQKIARNFSSQALLSRRENGALLNKYKKLTFEKLLRNYFKDEKLMSILSGQFGYLGVAPKDLAATSMCLMTVSYLRDGTYYPKGGAQSFSDSIAETFKKYGGELLLETETVKILTKNKKTAGIKTATGESYEADIVVSNGDAIRTFFNLIDKKEIGVEFLQKLRRMKIGSSYFMTFLVVKNDLDLKKKSGWYHSSYGLNIKPEQSLYVFVPSLVDNSCVSQNRHIIELAIRFPYEFASVKKWDSCKQKLRNRLLERAEQIIPGLRNSIEFEESATPKTIEKYTFNSHGSACGWEMNVNQVNDKRLPYETPIEGLYLAGHWTNPGCGVVPVTTSGWIVADKVMRHRNAKSKRAVLVRG